VRTRGEGRGSWHCSKENRICGVFDWCTGTKANQMREERENGKRERGVSLLALPLGSQCCLCACLALVSKNVDCGFSF
jgi:hypothetical protein